MKEYDGVEDRLLGELQFAFIAFLVCRIVYYTSHRINVCRYVSLSTCIDDDWSLSQMGQSLDGFLQWKSLVSLLLGCTEAVSVLSQNLWLFLQFR